MKTTKLLNYLKNIENSGIHRMESDAFASLSKFYDMDVVEKAAMYLLKNGSPPGGKMCPYPLSKLAENTNWIAVLGGGA